MAFGFCLGVFILLSVWPSVTCSDLPRGAIETACRDRYLLVTTQLSFAGNEPRFEAVDADGVHPITKQYGSECGYMFSILPLPGHAELRASYFSCHTDNQDDEVFTFSFNLITIDANGVETTYHVNANCSLPLPWSPREFSCEENYMEVSVRGDVSGLPGTKADNWTAALATAHSAAMSTWQVMFQQEGQQLTSMSFSEARELGYVFHLTQGRLVFRSPYTGSVMGSVTMVNGTFVEMVYPILVSRQRWVVIMVNLVVACSTDEGMYDGAGLVWQTPTLLSPLVSELSGLESSKISFGVAGQLLDEPITAERGYSLDISDTTVQISIPFNADGGYRKSFVMDNMYHEFYVVRLYYEQTFMDDSGVETRLRLHRPMNTPLLIQHPSIINQTVLEARVFTVYLGNLSYDVDLVAVKLNGHNFTILEANKSGLVITMVSQPNSNLHAYVLRVPFDSVIHKLYPTEGLLEYSLDINYTLVILPQEEPYYYLASVVAQFNDVFPPVFKGVCNKKSISFQMDHKPFDYLWEVGVGPYLLTPNLAAKRGYIMQNDSQSLILEVPLFSVGYTYKDINLKQFRGTFEILSRVPKTLEVKSSLAKACLFQTTEVIVCSTEGVVTVVTDVTLAVPGAEPNGTFLLDATCRPQETDDTRARFSFGLHTCGTRVQVDHQHVTYENEINIEHTFQSEAPVKTRDTASVVTVRCVYPLSDLYKLFAYWRFEADSPGVGTILTRVPVKIFQPNFPPTTLTTTRRPLTSTTTSNTGLSPGRKMPGIHPRAKYVKVFSWQMNQPKGTT
uniref:Zona pellucida protein AX 4 n=1 Tax=Hucho hucho TaxID=62062 RepID=A0A4W5KCV5_9TELE